MCTTYDSISDISAACLCNPASFKYDAHDIICRITDEWHSEQTYIYIYGINERVKKRTQAKKKQEKEE